MAGDAVTVFFSYSHKDEALRDELANHLKILKLEGVITDWHDRQILPGDEWDREIKESLNSAQIILLLISSDFIASQYCWDIEITRAMERHEAGEACVIPVILRSCMWSSARFGKLQALPKNATPVTSTAWPSKDEAFTNVAEGIKKAANDIRQHLQAAKRAKLDQYEVAYRQAIQQEYPLNESVQGKLNRLQSALGLSDAEIAPIVTRLSAQYGEGRQKLEKYRHEVRLCLEEDGGEIYGFSRSILNGFRNSFGLTPEEASAVEQEEMQPYRGKAEAVAQYQAVFADALQHENSISEGTRRRLQRFQQTLGLSDGEVQGIEAPLLQAAEQQWQEQAEAAYAKHLRQYEEEFARAVETRYPLSERVLELLEALQQQLGLANEDVATVAKPIRDAAEAKYQQQLRVQKAEQKRCENEDSLSSEKGIDYSKLRDLLKVGDWKAADQETYEVMFQAVGRKSEKWFTYEEMLSLPIVDLFTIDRLWMKYSQGRFGFSIQQEIYVQCGAMLDGNYPGDKIWHKFCEQVGWRQGSGRLRYYDELIFSTTAPEGHLPAVSGGFGEVLVLVRGIFSRIETPWG